MINRIVIDKFKGIDHLEIKTAGNFNVIIGENNIGKSTIFEAIHLWKMCYDNNLKKIRQDFIHLQKISVLKEWSLLESIMMRIYFHWDVIKKMQNAK